MPDEAFVLGQTIGQGWLGVWSAETERDKHDNRRCNFYNKDRGNKTLQRHVYMYIFYLVRKTNDGLINKEKCWKTKNELLQWHSHSTQMHESLVQQNNLIYHDQSSNNPCAPTPAVPAVVLQPADVPQLNESRPTVCLVDVVLVIHPSMTGQSYVLRRRSTIRCGTPLQGPDWPACIQHRVPSIGVSRYCCEPDQFHTQKGLYFNMPSQTWSLNWDQNIFPLLFLHSPHKTKEESPGSYFGSMLSSTAHNTAIT